MSVYSIKDLENLSGIKAHTLRIWEQRYNIISPKRTDTNIRYYDDRDLKLVLNISLLQEHGFKISKIAEMSPEAMHRQVLELSDQGMRHADQIQALTISMVDLDEERFEKILTKCALQMGFEQTMMQIIFPFLTKIGILWQTGAINPAHEHFISHLIRQKVIVATDGQVMNYGPATKKYMLFLPDGEMHELSLLFANYLLRTRRQRVVYLGQSLPFQDVETVYNVHRPDYIFTVITSTPGPDEVQGYINKLSAAFPKATVLVSGYQTVSQDIYAPDNVIVVRKIQDLIEFVEENV
ncbi:MAG: MerR family transcriptional regulator [Cytophagales bacterium]|jgi:DNA-binding transcriptional MerR regulator|nr:MerR family transcriptional regulator [Cytophagales bacterium]